ncbi:Hypothetical predicted protein, partial [Marmota monax]
FCRAHLPSFQSESALLNFETVRRHLLRELRILGSKDLNLAGAQRPPSYRNASALLSSHGRACGGFVL